MNPPELSPASTIEIVFPTPMISKELVGSTAAESPLMVTPELKGNFHWVSTRSGHFILAEAPKFNASYDFALRKDLKDLTGKALSSDTLSSVSSAEFRVIDQTPKWFSNDEANRNSKFMFEFNDNVALGSAAPLPVGSTGGDIADALTALAGLGFKPMEASRAVAEARAELGDGAGVSDLIRVALRRSAR